MLQVLQPVQMTHTIQVVLPAHLRTLARVGSEISLDVEGALTQRSVLDALEARFPMLEGDRRRLVVSLGKPEPLIADVCTMLHSHDPVFYV